MNIIIFLKKEMKNMIIYHLFNFPVLNLVENKNSRKNKYLSCKRKNSNSLDVNKFRWVILYLYNSLIQKTEKTKKDDSKVIIIPQIQNNAPKKLPAVLKIAVNKKNNIDLERLAGGYDLANIYKSYSDLRFYGWPFEFIGMLSKLSHKRHNKWFWMWFLVSNDC